MTRSESSRAQSDALAAVAERHAVARACDEPPERGRVARYLGAAYYVSRRCGVDHAENQPLRRDR